MKLVVGLGNPGVKYLKTRHNTGFKVLDFLANRKFIRFKNMFFHQACYAKFRNNSFIVRMIKPTLFMNNSGEVIYKLMKKWKVRASDLIVIYDDVALDLGNIKIKPKGSAGSHNGMKSIINFIGTENFLRVRVGIGPLPSDTSIYDFVLDDFNQDEYLKLEKVVERAADAVESLFSNGIEKTMSNYNNFKSK